MIYLNSSRTWIIATVAIAFLVGISINWMLRYVYVAIVSGNGSVIGLWEGTFLLTITPRPTIPLSPHIVVASSRSPAEWLPSLEVNDEYYSLRIPAWVLVSLGMLFLGTVCRLRKPRSADKS